jgi:polyisoprenoid-binding protein YceI
MGPRPDTPAAAPTAPAATAPTATAALPLVPGRWALDEAHARVGFAARHLGLAKVRGVFTDVDATLVVGPSPEHTTVEATIATASIDTGNAVRDANLRGEAVLDVERRPTITFRSTGISGADGDWRLDGELTVGDVTGPISLDVELAGVGEVFGGGRHAGFEARGELRRKDFGLSFGPVDPAVGQVVELTLDLEFVEPG